jgi:hypothetical protein
VQPDWTHAQQRTIYARALDRVVVLPYPRGQPSSQLDWSRRSALLQQRLRIAWAEPASSWPDLAWRGARSTLHP